MSAQFIAGYDEWWLIDRRVGDIVDIKVNGAVQKG
jgi:hypothetical protein